MMLESFISTNPFFVDFKEKKKLIGNIILTIIQIKIDYGCNYNLIKKNK